jgi:HSP20 family protein
MNEGKELQVQDKKELESAGETTVQARYFIPPADIFETDEELTVVLEMPGVARDSVSADIENDKLTIEGRLDFTKYEGFEPLYTEYNIGHFKRSFVLSNKIDQDKISADLNDGVLIVKLPKAEAVKPRKIAVN